MRAAAARVSRTLCRGRRFSADADHGEDPAASTVIARLRRLEPDPVAELSHGTASSRGIGEGDWMAITTPRGRVRARARLNPTLADGIVAARHGWWQACPELGLPSYDALDPDGANINLAIGVEAADPVSGAASHRCYPCRIEKLA